MPKKNPSKTIKKKISQLDPSIPGTIRKVRLKCGKVGCRCQSGKAEDRHGPYYFWNRPVRGKMTSCSIPKGKVTQVRKMIENRRKLEKLVDRLLAQGQKDALKLIDS